MMVNLLGRRDGGSEVDYTVNPQIGFPRSRAVPTATCTGQSCPSSVGRDRRQHARHGHAGRAERHRDRTGFGQLVTLALKDVGLAMLGHLGMIAEVMPSTAWTAHGMATTCTARLAATSSPATAARDGGGVDRPAMVHARQGHRKRRRNCRTLRRNSAAGSEHRR
jgi:hypothetical protein